MSRLLHFRSARRDRARSAPAPSRLADSGSADDGVDPDAVDTQRLARGHEPVRVGSVRPTSLRPANRPHAPHSPNAAVRSTFFPHSGPTNLPILPASRPRTQLQDVVVPAISRRGPRTGSSSGITRARSACFFGCRLRRASVANARATRARGARGARATRDARGGSRASPPPHARAPRPHVTLREMHERRERARRADRDADPRRRPRPPRPPVRPAAATSTLASIPGP